MYLNFRTMFISEGGGWGAISLYNLTPMRDEFVEFRVFFCRWHDPRGLCFGGKMAQKAISDMLFKWSQSCPEVICLFIYFYKKRISWCKITKKSLFQGHYLSPLSSMGVADLGEAPIFSSVYFNYKIPTTDS